MKIRKQQFLLVIAGMLLWGITSAQNVFTVTDSQDHPNGGGLPGQLRWAINQANAATGESIIKFDLPGDAPFNISIQATLPLITKTVTIDGTTQPGYNPSKPNNPVIVINGYANGNGPLVTGLVFNNSTRSKVTGVWMKQFIVAMALQYSTYCEISRNIITQCVGSSSIVLHLSNAHFNTIKGNYINVDTTLSAPSGYAGATTGCREGILIQSSNDNIIGGTACGEGNTIAWVYSEGIDNYSNVGQRNRYSGNRIFENSVGFTSPRYEILLRTTGNGGKLPPVITSTGCDVSGTSQGNNTIELFGSTGPAASRTNARIFMGSTKANAAGQWTMPVSNVVYPYVTATATDSLNNTSELCTVSAITLDSVKLVIKKPSVCVKEKITFEVMGPKCAKTLNYVWTYGDGVTGYTPEHVYNAPGTYAVTLTAYDKNNCQSLYKATTSVTATACAEYDCAPCNFTLTGNGISPTVVAPKSGSPDVINASTVSAVVKINGGTPPYTYAWSVLASTGVAVTDWWYTDKYPVNPMPPEMSAIQFMNYGPATYTATVVVTDASGCSAYKIFTQ